jgi:hypothetical protein
MPRKITRKTAGNCEDKTCPAVWDTTDPDWVGIRIKRPDLTDDLTAAGETPADEMTGFIPRAILDAWASGQQ